MPRLKLKDKNVRKIGKIAGGSYYVTIPIEIVKKLGWIDGQRVVVKKIRGRQVIKIEDFKP